MIRLPRGEPIVRVIRGGLAGLVMFLGAFLYIVVQPMLAKQVLPALGGSPAVWTTCLMFYQSVLLIGYALADQLTRGKRDHRVGVIAVALPLALALAGLAFLPLGLRDSLEQAESTALSTHPAWTLLSLLATAATVPLLAVSLTAPLVQAWSAREAGTRVYSLYALSNVGSLMGLVAYPLVIEPRLPLRWQADLWRIGYLIWLAAMVLTAIMTRARHEQPAPLTAATAPPSAFTRSTQTVNGKTIGTWVLLAFLPSSLLQGVTMFLTTDVAAVPLLWMMPLGLYLGSFVLVFASKRPLSTSWAAWAFAVAVMVLLPVMAVGLVQWVWMPVHLIAFALACLLCHGALVDRKPSAERLTLFYLSIALGGWLGSVFNALIAPLIFDRVLEYPLVIVAICAASAMLGSSQDRVPRRLGWDLLFSGVVALLALAVARSGGRWADQAWGMAAMVAVCGLVSWSCWTHRRRRTRFALVVAAVWIAAGLAIGQDGSLLLQSRNFHGISRVTRIEPGPRHRFFHGSTLHGEQDRSPSRGRVPLSYFHKSGPVGQIFEHARAILAPRRILVIGLGAGTLACYAQPGEEWMFLELDPEVLAIAENSALFSFLADCQADRVETRLGDARVSIGRLPDHAFDLIVFDAFSSDSVPAHLLTREALALYESRLRAGGWLVVNLSNRYLDLESVLRSLADDGGWSGRARIDDRLTPTEKAEGKQGSIWGVLARSNAALAVFDADDRWHPLRAWRSVPVWTDEVIDPFAAWKWVPSLGLAAPPAP